MQTKFHSTDTVVTHFFFPIRQKNYSCTTHISYFIRSMIGLCLSPLTSLSILQGMFIRLQTFIILINYYKLCVCVCKVLTINSIILALYNNSSTFNFSISSGKKVNLVNVFKRSKFKILGIIQKRWESKIYI